MATADCEYLNWFPGNCALGNACKVRAAHARLREAHRHWHDALNRYDNIDSLHTYLNATLQSLRNVTFALQASKAAIPNFDDWYPGWQTAFKSDPVMRWAVESRNRVVKDSDLETRSRTKAVLLGSVNCKPTIELDVPPLTPNQEIMAKLLAGLSPSDSLRRDGIVGIERRWIDADLPEREILDALAHVFGRLAQLLVDCHVLIGIPEDSRWRASPPDGSLGVNASLCIRPPCMIAFDDQRTAWIRTSDGDEIALIPHPLVLDPSSIDVARSRYGYAATESMKAAVATKSLRERARAYWNAARHIMEKDGAHAGFVLLFKDGVPLGLSTIEFPDNAAKLVYWDAIGRRVEKTGANEIITISEPSQARFDARYPDRRAAEAPDRRELLSVDALSSNGECISVFGFIIRTADGVAVGDPEESLDAKMYYLDEVRRAWGLPLGKHMEEVDVEELREKHRTRMPTRMATFERQKKGTIGRNDPCPCGSGKKFKKCHWRRWF